MSPDIRRYSGEQHIPLVEYLRVYAGQTEWTAWYGESQIQKIDTIDPKLYRLHLVDGSTVEVSYRVSIRIYRSIDEQEG